MLLIASIQSFIHASVTILIRIIVIIIIIIIIVLIIASMNTTVGCWAARLSLVSSV